MQRIDVPPGEHNPQGYTGEQILEELRGMRGSRHMSFRYELLDKNDNKIRDLKDEVESCSIEQNWLAEIKRKANFVIRDYGTIDWMSDRIKPWIKLHMPSVRSKEGRTVDTVWYNGFNATSGNVTTANSADHGNNLSSVSGTVRYSSTWVAAGDGSCLLGSDNQATTGEFTFGFPTRRTWKMSFYMNIPSGGRLHVECDGIDPSNEHHLEFDDDQNSFKLGDTDISHLSANLIGQAVRVDAINDGRRTRYRFFWSDIHGDSPNATVTNNTTPGMRIHRVRVYGGGSSTPPSRIDELRVSVHNGPEIVPRTRPIWRNTFNGTPGHVASVSNLGSHGNVPVEVRGESVYTADHSADDRRALQLGSTGGENSGEITASIPARREWRLRFWAHVPSNGKLYVLPSGETSIDPPDTQDDPGQGGNPAPQPQLREPNWIILDGVNSEYSIAGTDVSSFTSLLVNRLIRIEMEAEESFYTWRVYSTDPHGETPDISWHGDASSWGQMVRFMFRGGGDGSTPPVIDNVRIGEPIPVDVETPADQNFVEWPQGVFLLTTPSRVMDSNEVITRNVEGFDKAIIYDDDLVDGRIAARGLRTVDDSFKRVRSGDWGTVGRGDGIRAWNRYNTANTTYGVQISPQAWGFVIVNSSPNNLRQMVLERPELRDVEVYSEMALNQAPTGAGAIPGIILRWKSTSNFYRVSAHVRHTGTIDLEVRHANALIHNQAIAMELDFPGQFIHIRTRIIGENLQAKMWRPVDEEPKEWQLNINLEDEGADLIDKGLCGLSAQAFSANTNTNLNYRYRRFIMYASPNGKYTDIIDILLGDSESKQVTPSDRVLASDREWDPGTSKRAIINELLEEINYESMSVDENGVIIIKPYIPPNDRPAEYEYADDQFGVMYPAMDQELDLHQVPNRWIAASSNPDQAPVRVAYENNDPSSPTSIPRRGRVITENVEGTEASDKATLLDLIVRRAFESTQVYEAIEFTTLMMPFHSGNDVYRIKREPLGVSSKYAEHTWSMNLEAGAEMRHRARRVITFDTSFDDSVVQGDLNVTGTLTANNIAHGRINIHPTANQPTSTVIFGLSLQGSGRVHAQATISSTAANTAQAQSMYYPVNTGVSLYVFRTNTVMTTITWFMMREH